MTRPTTRRLLLALASGLLMGGAFPPSPLGPIAALAWIPLFLLLEEVREYGPVLRWTYLSMFCFNAVTLYWAGGFVHGKDAYMMLAGALLLVAHPLWFSVPFLAWAVVRERIGGGFALVAFPFFWLALEFIHSSNQFAFPWLLLGNTQTYDPAMIQMASITGVYGISFLLVASNALGYHLFQQLRAKAWRLFSPGAIACLAALLLIQTGPRLFGWYELEKEWGPSGASRTVTIGVVQPNIDPFEKWAGHEEPQMETLLRLSAVLADSGADLLLWPETATPFYLLHAAQRGYYDRIREFVDRNALPLLSGIPDIVYYREGEEPPAGSKMNLDGMYYNNYNATILLQPKVGEPQKYAKVILVPFAEHVPYSEYLSALNAAQWNFGLGGWSIGRDSTLFRLRHKGGEAVFANFICYESVFPGYVASYARKGAEFLTVVTNDSWWGNTSGAYQHERYATLRAVENRRWVVQCANGGISSFVDPAGRVVASAPLYSQAAFTGVVELREDRTFYAEHGDWFARACLYGACAALAFALVFPAIIRKGVQS